MEESARPLARHISRIKDREADKLLMKRLEDAEILGKHVYDAFDTVNRQCFRLIQEVQMLRQEVQTLRSELQDLKENQNSND